EAEAKAKADALAKAKAEAEAAQAAQAQAAAQSQAQNEAASSKDAQAASSGSKVSNGFDYSHLSVTPDEEEFLKEVLDKVGMLSASMLSTYVNGTKVKQRLNEAARLWVLEMIAQTDKAKKAA